MAVQDTVAVGLLTAVSTVTAVGLTALASGLVARGQRQHQSEMAARERREQRAVRRLELRREAYLRFLGRVDEAYRQLDERWTARPGPRPDSGRRDPVYRALRALDEANNQIMLEGPAPVAAQADLTIASIGAEYRAQRRLLVEHSGAAVPGADDSAVASSGAACDLAGLEVGTPRRCDRGPVPATRGADPGRQAGPRRSPGLMFWPPALPDRPPSRGRCQCMTSTLAWWMRRTRSRPEDSGRHEDEPTACGAPVIR